MSAASPPWRLPRTVVMETMTSLPKLFLISLLQVEYYDKYYYYFFFFKVIKKKIIYIIVVVVDFHNRNDNIM